MNKNRITRQLNRLKLIEEVITEYHKHKNYDVPNTVIWRKYIYPKFHISKSLFDNFLSVNVRLEREKLERLIRESDPKQNYIKSHNNI